MPSPALSLQPCVEEIHTGISPEQLFGHLGAPPGSVFLDSARSAGGLGAWSFLGTDPFLILRGKGDDIRWTRRDGIERRRGDAVDELARALARFECEPVPGIPFSGGAIGCLSYELCARMHGIRRRAPDDAAVPDLEFGFYDGILAFDRESGRCFVVSNPASGVDPARIFARWRRAISEAEKAPWAPFPPGSPAGRPRPATPKSDYLAAVRRVRDLIAAGDVYQVNLTQRFDASLSGSPYEVYRRLRGESPAPFAAFLHLDGIQVAGSSPERFLRIRGRRVETRPIKGTRPRGATEAEDRRLAQELLASEKDRAELLMIVDLERNDLGRVCEFGSVRVDEMHRLESHPTVHHLVAAVSGTLRPDCGPVDCLRAMFPGGSITGAPKIRAMQIIDEVEPVRRHLYTGAAGYLGFDGACDLNIAIRTIFFRGGEAWYHVGGGIVWDSDPEAEYRECLDKGRAMSVALCGEPGPAE